MQFARSMLVLLASPNYAYNDPMVTMNQMVNTNQKKKQIYDVLISAWRAMAGDSAAMLVPYFSKMYCL